MNAVEWKRGGEVGVDRKWRYSGPQKSHIGGTMATDDGVTFGLMCSMLFVTRLQGELASRASSSDKKMFYISRMPMQRV